MEDKTQEKKIGIGAYISLFLAVIFFSGLLSENSVKKYIAQHNMNPKWIAISTLDFGTLNGSFGKVLSPKALEEKKGDKAEAAGHGHGGGATTNFRGKDGSGARDGFMFAFSLVATVMFAIASIAVFEMFGALSAARALITPILKPIMGVPGSAALALIAALQSSDVGGSMTRDLHTRGEIDDDERDIFAMFQFSAGATLGNFLSSGAILYTLTDGAGKGVADFGSIAGAIGVILIFKIFGANVFRLFVLGKGKDQKPQAKELQNETNNNEGAK